MKFSEQEIQLISKTLNYWGKNWDWECPTLFGVSKERFKCLANKAYDNANLQHQDLQNIVVAGVRELLVGANAIDPNKHSDTTGFDTPKTNKLAQAILSKCSEE